MRIGFVTGEYPPMQGGVGAFTREVARAMIAKGHEVYVFTRALSIPSDDGVKMLPVVGATWGWDTLRAVAKWSKLYRLDVINIQFQTAAYDMHPAIHWLPLQIKSIPSIVTFHDLRVPYLFPKAGPIREMVVRKLAHDANGAIATDRADARCLAEAWKVPNVEWIPIGSNINTALPQNYDREMWRDSISVTRSDLLISYFGFLNESKGALILVEALARLRDKGIPAKLVMIGGREGASDPTDRDYGREVDAAIAAHELAHNIHWTGFVEDAEVAAYFRASDIAALPYRDGVSLRRGTLMAALANGRAIITTTPQVEAPELADALITVPPDNVEALAEAILSMWQDKERRTRLEAEALRTSQSFTWDSIAHRTIDFYRCVLKS
jgi:glycosyltransferase involved in cell wall biosynthesis